MACLRITLSLHSALGSGENTSFGVIFIINPVLLLSLLYFTRIIYRFVHVLARVESLDTSEKAIELLLMVRI